MTVIKLKKEFMKRLHINILFLLFGLGILISCEDIEKPELNPAAVIVPELSETAVTLLEENAEANAVTLSWEQPEFGFTASPTYTIFIEKADGDFSEAIAITNAGNISKVFKTEELNKHLLNLGLEADVETSVKIKVEGKLGTYEKIVSEIINLTVTPYAAFLDLSTIWGVVGSGFNDWGAHPDAPFYKTKTENVLVAYVKLKNGEIKFRPNNAWDGNLGDNGADGTLEADGANITVTEGYYKITMNPVAKTYSIVAFTYGIVGSAYNNWGETPDFPFSYDPSTDQFRAIVKLQTGEFKIRKNNDWGLNYGDTGANGTLESGGDNIAVSAGKYIVTFNENELTYTIEEIPNIWGLVGSAYNDWGATADAAFDRDWKNDGVWILRNVKLLTGEFKIRDDNSWALNYGDDGADGSLNTGGANIASEEGYYTITLDFSIPESPTLSKVKH